MKSNNGNLPNLIVIGAMKCATTSFHYYLGLHPQIFMTREKELDFFVKELNWSKGISWYRSNFKSRADILGETSPNYTDFNLFEGVPERIHDAVPDAKLIYIVRDPIERIVSHYIHNFADGRENRTIDEALAHCDGNPYIDRSRYYMQIEKYLAYFPSSHILIITAEDLNDQCENVLKTVYRFLDVDDSFNSGRISVNWHKTRFKRRKNRIGLFLDKTPLNKIIGKLPFEISGAFEKMIYFPFSKKIDKPVLNDQVREAVTRFLKEDFDRLREYTGRKLWNIWNN